MNNADIEIKKLVESEVDQLLQEDAYYEQFATPLKSAKAIKLQQREYLVECLQFKVLRSQLAKATEIIFEALPHFPSITPEEWDKVKAEFENCEYHSEEFLKSVDKTMENRPVLLQEIFGFSDETMTLIYSLAVNLVEKEEFYQAECLFSLLTTLAPYVPSFWLAKGLCLQAENKHEEALPLFEITRLLNANSKEAIQYSIDSYLVLNEKDKADEALGQLKEMIINLDTEEERNSWEKIIQKY